MAESYTPNDSTLSDCHLTTVTSHVAITIIDQDSCSANGKGDHEDTQQLNHIVEVVRVHDDGRAETIDTLPGSGDDITRVGVHFEMRRPFSVEQWLWPRWKLFPSGCALCFANKTQTGLTLVRVRPGDRSVRVASEHTHIDGSALPPLIKEEEEPRIFWLLDVTVDDGQERIRFLYQRASELLRSSERGGYSHTRRALLLLPFVGKRLCLQSSPMLGGWLDAELVCSLLNVVLEVPLFVSTSDLYVYLESLSSA